MWLEEKDGITEATPAVVLSTAAATTTILPVATAESLAAPAVFFTAGSADAAAIPEATTASGTTSVATSLLRRLGTTSMQVVQSTRACRCPLLYRLDAYISYYPPRTHIRII